jgi:hypothetical protein
MAVIKENVILVLEFQTMDRLIKMIDNNMKNIYNHIKHIEIV